MSDTTPTAARAESPTEPPADSVAQFAADMRKLRLEADSPTLAKLQADTGISRTVLSDAFGGRQLPSPRTVDGIVRACGGDPHPWIDRRDALSSRAAVAAALADASAGSAGNPDAATGDAVDAGAFPVASSEVAAPPVDGVSGRSRATVGRGTAAAIGIGSFLLGVAATAVAALLLVPQLIPAAPVENAAQIAVETGVDPATTACVDDARVATGDTRADNSLLEIVWSDKCQAGWGRITRYDGLYAGNTVTIAIYPQTAPDGADRQEATEHDVQGAYTTLVVRPSPDTLLCAEGSFTVDGTRIDLGDPLCI